MTRKSFFPFIKDIQKIVYVQQRQNYLNYTDTFSTKKFHSLARTGSENHEHFVKLNTHNKKTQKNPAEDRQGEYSCMKTS